MRSFGSLLCALEPPAHRPRCGASRLRATRGGRHWVEGASCGPAAFGVRSCGSAGRAFRPVFLLARRRFWNVTPAARRRAPRGTPQRVRRAAPCGQVRRPPCSSIVHLVARRAARAELRASPQGTAPGRVVGCLTERPSGGGRTSSARAAGPVGAAARHHHWCADGHAQKSAGPQEVALAERRPPRRARREVPHRPFRRRRQQPRCSIRLDATRGPGSLADAPPGRPLTPRTPPPARRAASRSPPRSRRSPDRRGAR
jgi:hypothetical protein